MNGKALMKKTPSSLDDYIASQGRGRDTLVAHMSPREAMILKKMGGSGGINPKTGMMEFYDSDSEGDTADAAGPGGVGSSDVGGFGGGFDSSDFGGGGGWGSGYTGGPAPGGSDPNAAKGDPTGVYGMVENVKGLDPIGAFADKYGRAGMIGYGMAGPPGAVIGMLGKGLYEGAMNWSSLSPTEQAAAIATAQQGIGGTPGAGGTEPGLTAPTEVSPAAVALSPVEEEKRRRLIEENRFTYNQQMAGLSPRDVPYVRR